jgi:hydrogenase nickel incorporation protein HypA/HybF
MHELALMAELQQLAEDQARLAGAQVIHRLRLRVGTLTGVDPDALQQAFAVLVTGGEGRDLWCAAQLELERVPGRCLCSHCGQAFHPCDQIHACPRCGRISGQVLAGRELELVALEVS